MNVIHQYKNKWNSFLKIFVFIFLFTVLSGAIRKWFITDKSIGNIILLLQILLPYSFIFIRGSMNRWKIGKVEFFLLVLVLFIGIINPLNLTYYHGLLGFLLHLSFFFVLFFYINNRESFHFMKVLPLLVISVFGQLILVFFQYTQPADSFINRYADIEAVGSIALVGNAARVTGTFSYISGFTAFLFFVSFLIWALIKYQYKSIYVVLLVLGSIFACFMSGSRGATYLFIIFLGVIFASEYNSLAKIFFNVKLLLPTAIFMLVIIGLGSEQFSNLLEASFLGFSERRRSGIETGEEQLRIVNDFIEVLNFRGNYPILGIGIGSTYQGANKLFGISPYITEYGFFESEFVRIVLEGGFLLLVTRFFIMYFLLKHLFLPRLAKFVLFLVVFLFFPIIFNVYNSVFAVLGIILIDHFYYNDFTKRRLYLKKAFPERFKKYG